MNSDLPGTCLEPGEKIRNSAFWLKDTVSGGKLKKDVDEIHALIENPELRRNHRKNALTELLEHSVRTVPYYRKLKDCKALRDFPILSKELLKANYEEFFSEKYPRSALHVMTTTGSYGTPFKFYLTPEKRRRQLAEIIYFSGWAGYRVGMRYAQMRGTTHSWWKGFLQNEVLINPWLMDERWLKNSRKILLNDKIRFLFEYPSPMAFLAEFCRAKGDTPECFSIVGACTSSENLTASMRQSISEVFGGTILSRYASQENGVLAHEHPDYGDKMLVNEADQIIELLALDSDEPVAPGETGRVVVTDLYSHAQPLIRYDIGDTAVFSDQTSKASNLQIIDRLEGRIIESLTATDGTAVSPYLVVTGLWGLAGIAQCQFVQNGPGSYLMRVVTQSDYSGDEEIIKRFLPFLGEDAVIEFEHSDRIEPLPSGKRPQVLNEWKMKCG